MLVIQGYYLPATKDHILSLCNVQIVSITRYAYSYVKFVCNCPLHLQRNAQTLHLNRHSYLFYYPSLMTSNRPWYCVQLRKKKLETETKTEHLVRDVFLMNFPDLQP